jgi:Nitrile hydratase beta subunit
MEDSVWLHECVWSCWWMASMTWVTGRASGRLAIRRQSRPFRNNGRRWPGRCWWLSPARSRRAGEFQYAIERMEPAQYLTSSYYEHWLTAAATLAVEHGLVTRSELEARAGGWFR